MSTVNAPTNVGVRYGKSQNNLSTTVGYQGSISSPSGSFAVNLTGLEAQTTYYYEAFMYVWDEANNEYKEITKSGSFTTLEESVTPTPKPDYLSCGEIPDINLSGSTTSGYYDNSTYNFGDTQWYRYGVSGNSNQVVVTHTFENEEGEVMRNYTLLYDKTKRAALWVAFAMNKDVFPWSVSRDDAWVYDPAISQDWQPNLSSSYNSANGIEYDRGHQAASYDRRTTLPQTRQTTFFSNMTPQVASFNQGTWQTLEEAVQNLGKTISGTTMLYVVTGPIFGSGYTSTTDKSGKSCPVPTQYYKCLMKVTYNANGDVTSASGEAIIMNNEEGASRQVKTIDYVENLTGFDFFANITASYQNTAEANITNLI